MQNSRLHGRCLWIATSVLAMMLVSCSTRTRPVQSGFPEHMTLTEQMKIAVDPGQNREFSYTNKRSAFYYGYTNAYNDRFFQGLTDYRQKLFDDYFLSVDNSLLVRAEAKVTASFHQLARDYGQTSEHVTLIDDRTVLLVQVEGGRQFDLTPVFADKTDQYQADWDPDEAILFVTREEWLSLPDQPGMPRWLGIYMGAGVSFGTQRPPYLSEEKNALGSLSCLADGNVAIVFAADHDRGAVADLIGEAHDLQELFIRMKSERLERLLSDSFVHTDDDSLNQAVAWAKVSMDALVMNQDKRGIFAGLPWFNDYWGRDTFISLPGALLVTGQFDQAREILSDFGTYQLTDPANPLYGRIPNRIRPDEVIYNTADGTPWFVREAFEYILYSGDTAFAQQIYPTVKRSVEGTIRYRVDEHGFLRHDGADTWMDAKIDGAIPWSSRGDRACDIQALWYTQLVAAAKLAQLVGDDSGGRERWLDLAGKVRRSFAAQFVWKDGRDIYDHLRPDGTADGQYRPNQLFCLTVPFAHAFSEADPRAGLNGALGQLDLDLFAERLVYPFGVGSLWKEELDFHPYHHHPNYHFDASYHNGIVWTWLSGPAITAFCREGRTAVPRVLFQSLTEQILRDGAVGTIPELIDAAPKPGESKPEFSGTFTQAWSLAEYVRNFYQDILGVYPLSDTYGFRFSPSPMVDSFGKVQFSLSTGYGHIMVVYDSEARQARLAGIDLLAPLPVTFYDERYLISPGEEVLIPLPGWKIEPGKWVGLAKPEVPEGTRSLREKNYLETKLRSQGEQYDPMQ